MGFSLSRLDECSRRDHNLDQGKQDKTWRLDFYLNIFREPSENRRPFFEGDPEHTDVHMALASYPSVIVLAERSIRIDPGQMMQIKVACFTQLSAYHSAEECSGVIDRIYARYDSKALRQRARL